jgi:hypothetical protein
MKMQLEQQEVGGESPHLKKGGLKMNRNTKDYGDDIDRMTDDNEDYIKPRRTQHQKVDEDKENPDPFKTKSIEDTFTVRLFVKNVLFLEAGEYLAVIREISSRRIENGRYGSYIEITIPFEIKVPGKDEIVQIDYKTSDNLSFNGKLYPLIKEILNIEPYDGFPIRQLEGKKALVEVVHDCDRHGERFWEKILKIRKVS